MAGVRFAGSQTEISTGTSVKTLLQVVAATNQRVLIKEWSMSFKGTSNTAAPILAEALVQSTAGTMTSLTLVLINAADNETLQTTAQHTATAEPTAGNVLMREEISLAA